MTDDQKVNEVCDKLDKKDVPVFCKDCKYCKEPHPLLFLLSEPKCTHPQVITISYDRVSGRKKIFYPYCRLTRGNHAECLPSGKLFERK